MLIFFRKVKGKMRIINFILIILIFIYFIINKRKSKKILELENVIKNQNIEIDFLNREMEEIETLEFFN